MPPKRHELEIIEGPNRKLAPRTGAKTSIKRGDTVIITAEKDATELTITFKDGRTPFDEPLAYGKELTVTATFDARNPDANLYTYTCEFIKNGQAMKSDGGGQFEIATGD